MKLRRFLHASTHELLYRALIRANPFDSTAHLPCLSRKGKILLPDASVRCFNHCANIYNIEVVIYVCNVLLHWLRGCADADNNIIADGGDGPDGTVNLN